MFLQVSCANSCEICREVFKSKNVRELQCGHRFHKGVRVLCGCFHVTCSDCGAFRKEKGTFPPRLQPLPFPSKSQTCLYQWSPSQRLCCGEGSGPRPLVRSARSSLCRVESNTWLYQLLKFKECDFLKSSASQADRWRNSLSV